MARRAWIFIPAALLVRFAFMALARIDSDEPQHLHVAWTWSQGLVQYRDVFDNHFPLLHLLFAPLMAIAPESSSVFSLARIAIAPFAIACSWLVYVIAKQFLDKNAALVAAIAFSVLPPWLPKSIEFRNDTLWIFFWLASIALVLKKKHALGGVAAALCLLASVKALPLLLAHALAIAAQRFVVRDATRFAIGVTVPLAATALFFLLQGALDDMLYATLSYNAALPVHAGRRLGGALAFAAIAPALAIRSPHILERAHPLVVHLALFASWYTVVLLCFWPLLTPRDFLPLIALAAIGLAALRVSPALVIIAATVASVAYTRPADTPRRAIVDTAVKLAAPNEVVFDLKGETVFRRRAVFPIYETVGQALTDNGTLEDRGPEELAARGCCVAIRDASWIPPRTRAFLNAHFVDAGAMRVCGTKTRATKFTIAVPQTYAVIAEKPVTIDGVPYDGPRFLAAGEHTASEPVTVIYSASPKNRT